MPAVDPILRILTPVLPLVVAFLLSLTVALGYRRIQQSPPADKFFVQTLALAGVVSALIVVSIGDSIARGIGLVGALTVIRFRSTLKNPRDLIFAFAALAVGVAAGAHAFAMGVVGTGIFVGGMAASSHRWIAGTGMSADLFDAVLSFRATGGTTSLDALGRALNEQCEQHTLIRLRQAGIGGEEHVYHVRLRPAGSKVALFRSVEQIDGISGPQLVAYDATRDV